MSTLGRRKRDVGSNFNPSMDKGGGVGGGWGWGWMPPQQIFPIFLGNGKAFLQTKFLVVGSSLGHLSMKKFFRSDLSSWL